VTVGAGGKEKALAVEASLGAVLSIVGIAWLIPARCNYHRDSPDNADKAYLDEKRRPELGAASLLGFGAGLAAGAGLTLVTRAVLRRDRIRATILTPITAPRTAGLSLQGNF